MQGITFKQFMQKCSESTSLLEEYTYYVFRTDTNQILARGVRGFDAAKETANQLRKRLQLRWDHVKFKAERKEKKDDGGKQFGVSSDGRNFTDLHGRSNRIDYAPRYNPSKGRRFRGYYDQEGNFHDID